MGAHTEYRPAGITIGVSRLARVVALTLVFAAFAGVAALGGYHYGKSDHQRSEASIARERETAVREAVTKAVAAKGAADHVIRLRIVDRHVAAQRAQDMQLLDRVLLREQQAGDRRAAAAYERGRQSAQPVAKPPEKTAAPVKAE